MAELTLEMVAQRLVDLERKVAELSGKPGPKDWQRTVGMFEGDELMAQVDAEIMATREAERIAARAGQFE